MEMLVRSEAGVDHAGLPFGSGTGEDVGCAIEHIGGELLECVVELHHDYLRLWRDPLATGGDSRHMRSMATRVGLAHRCRAIQRLVDLVAAPFASIIESLRSSAREVSLAPDREDACAAIIVQELRMPEVDAGVDHSKDHTRAVDPLLQRVSTGMRLVGMHMRACRILIGCDGLRQLQPPYSGVGS